MRDERKTKKQLLEELQELRRSMGAFGVSNAKSEGEGYYKAMVEASPVSIMTISNGKLIFVNPAGTRMLGFPRPQAMLGMSALEFIAPESKADVAERIEHLEKGMDNPTTEIELIRQDGVFEEEAGQLNSWGSRNPHYDPG